MDSLAGTKLFSVLDLASGYWQGELDPADKDKTTFVTPFGLHQFRVMPFGLTNAPSTFQRLMSLVVFSQTVEEHLQRLAEVLRRLKDAGLKVKPSKCQLLSKSVQYLRHVVSEKGVEADPAKISCFRDWPVRDSRESLRRFLGFVSYYRKFISNFARIAVPLHALTERSKSWHWTTQCEAAFTALKDKLLSPLIVSFPQFDKTFVVDTDASQDGLGAVLSQDGDSGHVIAYASRVLTKAERQYCATRREMLADVWAVRYFRAYLWGRCFVIRTDHNSLQWLKSFKDPQGQARWLDILAEYDFRIQHRPGAKHGNADALSRLPCKQCGLGAPPPHTDPVEDGSCDNVSNAAMAANTRLDGDPKQGQKEDADLKQVVSWLLSNNIPPALPTSGSYTGYKLCGRRKISCY